MVKIPSINKLRKRLKKSQREMAEILGVSKKTVESYEQGWRNVPPHIERLVILHAILHRGLRLRDLPYCWKKNECEPSIRNHCPAYEVRLPGFCWFITGTMCHGRPMGSWAVKRKSCLKCGVLQALLGKA